MTRTEIELRAAIVVALAAMTVVKEKLEALETEEANADGLVVAFFVDQDYENEDAEVPVRMDEREDG